MEKTMKLLLENWRKFLLTEAAMTAEDLMSYEDVELYVIIQDDGEDGIDIWLAGPNAIDGEILPRFDYLSDPPGGSVNIMPSEYGVSQGNGDCDGAWMVVGSAVSDGWGPLLYDIAIEYATERGGKGLIADRDQVSDDARAVWDYYHDSRGEVKSHQLDDLHNTLTPEEEDNCDQYVASVGGKYDWQENSLSKRYTKPPTTIDKLKEMGRLIDQT
jgi:hypothetical protein